MTPTRLSLGGPWFEDLKHGQVFDDAPAVTLTDGLATLHQSLSGDRLRLPLDHELSRWVTGRSRPLAHPTLVCHVAIGASTAASPAGEGQPLLPAAADAAARPHRRHPDDQDRGRGPAPEPAEAGPARHRHRGLRIQVENQRNKPVLDFWRCPMIPLRDPEGDTGHADSFDDIPADIDLDCLTAKVPWGWRLSAFKDRVGRAGTHFADVVPGTTFVIEGRDTVTNAPELARATLNLASAHTDPAAGPVRTPPRLRRPHDLPGRRGRHPGAPQSVDDPRLAEL